jgi:hypothetical protein
MKTSTTTTLALGIAVLAALVYQSSPTGEVSAMASSSWKVTPMRSLTPPAAIRLALGAGFSDPAATDDRDYRLPDSSIAASDRPEPFGPRPSRFWKVPRNLVTTYEEAARDYRIPVRYLTANGSYESLFNPTLMGDGHRSCGIHQFHHFRVVNGQRDWTIWGFSSLQECQDPKANIRMTAKVWRARMDNHDPNARCNGFLSCAIRLHKGYGASSYMRTIMAGADSYYGFPPNRTVVASN